MTRAAHIHLSATWPTTPDLRRTDRPAPLLLEEKGLGAALSEVEGDEVDWPPEQRSVTEYYTPYTFSAKERDLETAN